ncbi:MAG: hypothetical protein IPJ34_38210 [Myxococcales bacterium]|nr:hypothetical protein [Myxococcales bacterium]
MRVIVVGLLLAMVGCGARIDDAPLTDGAVDTGGDGATTTDAASSACPAALPAPGDACSTSSTTACTYGADRLPWCRPRATCSGGAWSVVDWKCPACPTTPAVDGEPCAANGASCVFDRRVCGCGYGKWTCKTVAEGCPLPGPNEGDPCTTEGLVCDYGTFSTGLDAIHGLEGRCIGGRFHNVFRR